MTFDVLPALPLPWDVLRTLWMLLPLLPLAGVLLLLIAQYSLPKDHGGVLFHLVIAAQLLLGTVILLGAGAQDPVAQEITVSLWDHAILFRMDPVKLLHLAILMTPLLLAWSRYSTIDTPYLRVVFLFFLAGCSGVVATGDLFNLFVFYELMIMAAYVLVATKQNFAEAIKYMMFGSISSIAFLGGIIVLYAGGASFAINAQIFTEIPTANAWWAMVLFTLAFSVKSAFFPIALAPCHAAAGSLFSSFLASFTIFTGMIGLHYFVLQPAALLDLPAFFSLIRLLSVATICMSALILFWEPEYNRAVAQSTILSVGMTGLLLTQGSGVTAFAYVLVHAVYKSLLFMLGEDLQQTARGIRIKTRLTLLMLALGVFLASGITPGLTVHFKEVATGESWGIHAVLLFASFCVIGGFRKFHYIQDAPPPPMLQWRPLALYTAFALLAGSYYFLLGLPEMGTTSTLWDLSILIAALLAGRRIYHAFPRFVSLDRHWIYGLLNRQLFYIILLFCFMLLWLYPTAPPPSRPRELSPREPSALVDTALPQDPAIITR